MTMVRDELAAAGVGDATPEQLNALFKRYLDDAKRRIATHRIIISEPGAKNAENMMDDKAQGWACETIRKFGFNVQPERQRPYIIGWLRKNHVDSELHDRIFDFIRIMLRRWDPLHAEAIRLDTDMKSVGLDDTYVNRRAVLQTRMAAEAEAYLTGVDDRYPGADVEEWRAICRKHPPASLPTEKELIANHNRFVREAYVSYMNSSSAKDDPHVPQVSFRDPWVAEPEPIRDAPFGFSDLFAEFDDDPEKVTADVKSAVPSLQHKAAVPVHTIIPPLDQCHGDIPIRLEVPTETPNRAKPMLEVTQPQDANEHNAPAMAASFDDAFNSGATKEVAADSRIHVDDIISVAYKTWYVKQTESKLRGQGLHWHDTEAFRQYAQAALLFQGLLRFEGVDYLEDINQRHTQPSCPSSSIFP
ncbi:MAG: hypothetical protein MUC58_09915, partial [Rhizobiaceae bacterium]|nr:hypothetical protein [Rhizobiaceae bacterium]